MSFMNRGMQNRKQKIILWIIVALVVLSFLLTIVIPLWASQNKVPLVRIKGVLTPATANYTEKAFQTAMNSQAQCIIIELDSSGGSMATAIHIRDQMNNNTVPTIVFIKGQAQSAACLIALAGDYLYMTPGSTIGAGSSRIFDIANEVERSNEESITAWKAEMEAVALAHGRNAAVVRGFVDPTDNVRGLSGPGGRIRLNTKEALEQGVCDGEAGDVAKVMMLIGKKNSQIDTVNPGGLNKAINDLAQPDIAIILLILGMTLLVVEVISFGWGIPGSLGIICLGVYVFSQFKSGVTGWDGLAIFAVGVVLILIEMLAFPGLGWPGLGGLLAMGMALILASAQAYRGWTILIISALGTVLFLSTYIYVLKKRGLLLQPEETSLLGNLDHKEYMNQIGEALSPLNPKGEIIIKGRRLKVVSRTEYVRPGQKVRVVNIIGRKVVVSPEDNNEIIPS